MTCQKCRLISRVVCLWESEHVSRAWILNRGISMTHLDNRRPIVELFLSPGCSQVVFYEEGSPQVNGTWVIISCHKTLIGDSCNAVHLFVSLPLQLDSICLFKTTLVVSGYLKRWVIQSTWAKLLSFLFQHKLYY